MPRLLVLFDSIPAGELAWAFKAVRTVCFVRLVIVNELAERRSTAIDIIGSIVRPGRAPVSCVRKIIDDRPSKGMVVGVVGGVAVDRKSAGESRAGPVGTEGASLSENALKCLAP